MSDDNTITLKEFFKDQIDQLRRDLERHQESMVTRAEYEVAQKQLERSIDQFERSHRDMHALINTRHEAALEAIEAAQNRTIALCALVVAIIQVAIQAFT